MAIIVTEAELKAGDVLLYHGTEFISDLIRLFDGSTYSHASVFDGKNTLEALDGGIESHPIKASVRGAKFVDVYRFISVPGRQPLDGPDYPAKPVLDRIAFYYANRERYAYEQLLLLAMLAATRRIPVVSWIPGLNLVIRTVLDHAAGVLAKLMAGGKEPVICSELVYRCYAEATGGKYALAIRGADVLAPMFAGGVEAIGLATGTPLVVSAAGAAADPLIEEKAAFLASYAVAKGASPATFVAAAGGSGMRSAAVADFVTPRDLSRSPNLVRIGTLRAS